VRLEEREVYEKIQGTLSETQLEAIQEASRLFRLEHRGEASLVEYTEDLEPLL
jgi:hypothetical protein